MRERYLALCWGDCTGLKPTVDRLVRCAEASGLNSVYESEGLQVLATSALRTRPLVHGGGILIGDLYARVGAEDILVDMTPAFEQHVRRSGGQRLITDCWGRYVLLARALDGPALTVLRDPSGYLPAFSLTVQGLHIISSDVDDVFPNLGPAPPLDWDFVASFLTFPGLRGAQTGLEGVDDLLPGVSYRFGPNPRATVLWDPWTFAAKPNRLDGSQNFAALVRQTTEYCARALTSPYQSVLLELSGGLDSSILAAALKHLPIDASAATLLTTGADGDERRYARIMAARASLPLQEHLITTRGIELAIAAATSRLRPGAFALLQSSETALVQALRDAGADAFVSGTGGDNVFCAISTAAPAADAFLSCGPGRAMIAALFDLSRLHGCTLWTAGRLALKKVLRKRPPLWRRDASFLKMDCLPEGPPDHPWLKPPPGALPGQREHIALLISTQSYLNGYRRIAAAPILFPLLAQPLMELCLSIPSWRWIEGGRNRAVARDAFSEDLPAEILHRRTKGRLDSLAGELFTERRDELRALLLDGHLAKQGLLDCKAVAGAFDQAGSSHDDAVYRLLQCADAEAWVSSWIDAR